jgi:hypothetical protein
MKRHENNLLLLAVEYFDSKGKLKMERDEK